MKDELKITNRSFDFAVRIVDADTGIKTYVYLPLIEEKSHGKTLYYC